MPGVVKLDYSHSRVLHAPKVSAFRLEHENKVNALKQLRLEMNSSFETLHLLLDREVTLRRLLDQVLDDESSFDMKQDLNCRHDCEGKVVRSIRGSTSFLFQRCTKLCRLTEEARPRLVALEEQLRTVHARKHEALRGIETLEARLRTDLAGFGTSNREEAELNALRGEAEQLLRSHRNSYHERSALFHDGIRLRLPCVPSDPPRVMAKRLQVYKQVALRQQSKGIVKAQRKVLVLNPKSVRKEPKTFKEIVEQGRMVEILLRPLFFPTMRQLKLSKAEYRRLIWLRRYWHRASQEEGQALHSELYEIERRLIQEQLPLPSGTLSLPSSHLDMRIAPFLGEVRKTRDSLSKMNALLKSITKNERY